MARKWSNMNLSGALHFVTGNCVDRIPVFNNPDCCEAFLSELGRLNEEWPSKLIAYVLMPDHFHFISNPQDGAIREFLRDLKSRAAKRLLRLKTAFCLPETVDGHQVWQDSFKSMPLWSGWMVKQKVNYIHANPVKARLVKSARDYQWSSFKSYYSIADGPLKVDQEWSWPDDGEKLSRATKEFRLVLLLEAKR